MSRPRDIVLIGPIGAGKSTLLRALEGVGGAARKTQAISYTGLATDTPGEYLENPLYFRVLLPSAMEARWVLLVQDATARRNHYPPGFGRGFPGKTVGIVTKVDHPAADVERARRFLESLALSGQIMEVSAVSGQGIAELQSLLGLPPALSEGREGTRR
ncbi:MAG: EutP/PduV family microcompartment system protein [Symbiobacteriia bacterium]